MRQLGQRQDGFTLPEVLIALTILSIGLLGIAGLQYRAQDFNNNSTTRTSSVSIASMVMEEILSRRDTHPLFTVSVANQVWDLDTTSNATSLFLIGRYNATYSITTNNPVADMVRVDVTVNAPDGRTVTLTNYKRLAW